MRKLFKEVAEMVGVMVFGLVGFGVYLLFSGRKYFSISALIITFIIMLAVGFGLSLLEEEKK